MSDDKPIIDQLKEDERLKIDIPMEDEPLKSGSSVAGSTDIVEEFKRLGRQFADTLEGIFNSEDARRVETEVRAGMKSFADEVEKAFNQAKDSPTASRVKEEATAAKERVETGEYTHKAQEGIVSGLRWLSTELDKLANQFTPAATSEQPPAEKSPTE